MPINPIVLQRRLAEVGRIRIGQTVETTNGKKRPTKLSSFRFTSADKIRIEQIAHVYGGTVQQWTPPNGGAPQWEVITDTDSVPIVVPPQPVTQWMELWSGGGCTRRCDGDREMRSDQPCICAAADEMVCKPTTRLSVLLRDIEGLGSWRLESHGWNAAAELPGMAELLARAGGWIPGRLYLKKVRQVSDGQTKDFLVPAIAVDGVTPAQLLTGQGGAVLGLSGSEPVAQIEAGPKAEAYESFHMMLANAKTPEDCMNVWNGARAAGLVGTGSPATPERARLAEAISVRGKELQTAEAPETSEPVDGEIVDEDPDAIWQQIIRTAGQHGLSLSEVEAAFAKANGGTTAATASAGELRVFLDGLKAQAA